MFQILHRQHTPDLNTMLADLGNPNVRQLGRALGVSPSTAARWIKAGHAPRPVMLALFWLTRWGVSQINCQAHNDALLQSQLAACYRSQLEEAGARLKAAQDKLDHLSRIGDFGAANDPMPNVRRHVPALPVIAVPGEQPAPKAAPRKKTASQKRAELAAQRLEKRAEGPARPFDFLRAG
jgi:predicted DNA-binding transcriptional regulator AlpA